MGIRDEIIDLPSVQIDSEWYRMSLQIWHDGTKYAGRVWFDGAGTSQGGIPARRLFHGAAKEDVIRRVAELSDDDLRAQLRHALIDRRRYLPLRSAVDELLNTIRRLNQVAVDWRTGAADAVEAEREMERIEERLHDVVGRLRQVAGVEEFEQ